MELKRLKLIASLTCFIIMTACRESRTNGYGHDDTTVAGNNMKGLGNEVQSIIANRETDFVMDVVEDNVELMAWLRAGMALGTDTKLRYQARRMLADQQRMDKEFKLYAGKKNIHLDDIDTSETVLINSEQENDWTAEWADEIGDQHRRLIRRFERGQKRIQDIELDEMIAKTLPVLHAHVDTCKKLEK